MSIVYDFPSIASRLRKDDFFTSTKIDVKPAMASSPTCIQCLSGSVVRRSGPIIDYWHCEQCGISWE